MVGNHILLFGLDVTVKLNFRPYIQRYTSPSENFDYNPLNMKTMWTLQCLDTTCIDIKSGSTLLVSMTYETDKMIILIIIIDFISRELQIYIECI